MNTEFITTTLAPITAFVMLFGGIIVIIKYLHSLKEKIDNMQDKLGNVKDELNDKLINVKDDINEMKIEIVKLQSGHVQLEQRMDHRFDKLETRVGNLEQRFDKYDGVHTDIETNIAELQTQIIAQKRQSEEQTSRITAVKEQYIEQITEVKTTIEKQDTRLTQVETDTYSTLKDIIGRFMDSAKKTVL